MAPSHRVSKRSHRDFKDHEAACAKYFAEEKGKRGKRRRREKQFFGMKLQALHKAAAEKFETKTESGVLVVEVEPESVAAKADVWPADVITEIDHKPIMKLSTGEELLGNHDPEKNVLLFLDRKGEKNIHDSEARKIKISLGWGGWLRCAGPAVIFQAGANPLHFHTCDLQFSSG